MNKRRTWEECVTAAQAAATKKDGANWEIGRAALDAVPLGHPGRDTQIRDAIVRFANDVGLEFRTIERARSVVSFYGGPIESPTRGGVDFPWSVYRDVMPRFQTKDAAVAFLDSLGSKDPGTPSGLWTVKAVTQYLSRRDDRLSTTRHVKGPADRVGMVLRGLEKIAEDMAHPDIDVSQETRNAVVQHLLAVRELIERARADEEPTANAQQRLDA